MLNPIFQQFTRKWDNATNRNWDDLAQQASVTVVLLGAIYPSKTYTWIKNASILVRWDDKKPILFDKHTKLGYIIHPNSTPNLISQYIFKIHKDWEPEHHFLPKHIIKKNTTETWFNDTILNVNYFSQLSLLYSRV